MTSRTKPSPEFPFFYYDEDFHCFRTIEDRDKAAQEAIDAYLDDHWLGGVRNIVAGQITQHTVAKDVELMPERKDFDSVEDHEAAMDDYGHDDCDYTCRYALVDLSDPGEKTPS